MMFITFVHVFDNHYASRITLNIQRSIHKTTYKVNKVSDQMLNICDISLIHPRPPHYCYWFTKTFLSLATWSLCCLWHHRPWHFTHSALILVWHLRLCSQLV